MTLFIVTDKGESLMPPIPNLKRKKHNRYKSTSKPDQREAHGQSVISTEADQSIEKTSKLNTNREFSIDITKDSNEVLRLLNILKKRKEKRQRKPWVPSGLMHKVDGINTTQKVYY